jgi:hypothetical protein
MTGSRLIDIIFPNSIPPTTINRIALESAAESVRTLKISLLRPFLKARTPIKATKAPIAPASVAVNNPENIPPIIITTKRSTPQVPGIAENRSFQVLFSIV